MSVNSKSDGKLSRTNLPTAIMVKHIITINMKIAISFCFLSRVLRTVLADLAKQKSQRTDTRKFLIKFTLS
jgi:hypothetical protein